MRVIPTLQCRPGMRLGKAIYTEKGNVLLGFRYELNATVIDRLHRMGIHYLYIDEPDTADIQIEDAIREETKMALYAALQNVLETVVNSSGKPSNVIGRHCSHAVAMLIEDLNDQKTDSITVLYPTITHEKAWADQWIRNAIQCSIYATKLGMLQELSRDELSALSFGALLHDVGMLKLPSAILDKSGSLTRDEFEIIKTHTTVGYKLLKDEPGFPLLAAHCALFHHERLNGSGYPFGMNGGDIHPIARWVGLIDAYVAMTSPRGFRKAMLPHEAMEMLYAGANIVYDLDKVEVFRNKVVTFPPGISVALSTGEIGVVSRVNQHNKQRPIVRVMRSQFGELEKPYELDLSVCLNVMIDRVGVDDRSTVTMA